jgi:RNA polymerase sigma-70 factor, ECF subfamily
VPVPLPQPQPVSRASACEPPHAATPDSARFSDIVREHSRYVFRVLRCLGVRHADLEDVCQEVFIVVHRKLPSYEPRAALSTWIYAIALRVVSDYHKRAYRKRETLVERLPELRAHAQPEDLLALRQDWELLDKLMNALSAEQRQVFVLYEVEALALREIAEIVGSPVQTVHSRLQAARKHVATQLARTRAQGGTP